MKVTTKGRVTIPMELREQLGIQPGAEVEFAVDGNTIRMTPVRKAAADGRRIVQRLRGRATVRTTTDEILALTRNYGTGRGKAARGG
jgi:AbrB family looped-hinge helix DNA binding protein